MSEIIRAAAAVNPVLFLVVIAAVLAAGGLGMVLVWRIIGGYERVKKAIQEMIDAALEQQREHTESRFADHFRDESGWRSRIELAQRETLDKMAALSSKVEDLALDVADVKMLVRGMEAERASRHELEEIARRQIEALMTRPPDEK